MPMRETASRTTRRTSPEGLRLGERLRQLRVAAGLTQSELAGDRFSKEYVSQIERGKTRPTEGTIEWLADRLGVDAGFLASGVATDERARLEGALSRAEALYEAQQDTEAVEAFEPLVAAARATGMPELQVRALAGSGLAKMRTGEHRAALALFNEALGLAERSGLPCDALKANILSWRSRCWQRQRDFEAARDDVERALELSQGVEDLRTIGAAYFQASLIADREGHWVLARNYAERAREAYGQLSDRVHVSQLTNNLGGLNFLLGNTDQAGKLLKESFAIALDLGRDADAGRAVSSLAQVHLRTGSVELAEDQARQALDLLDGRVDYVDEIGSAQLVLGRSLLEQGRLDEAETAFIAAETSYGELGSGSHRAAVWVARGDLAARRGDHERAAELYRTAAEALQDVRF